MRPYKPHVNMPENERKAYLEYVFNNELTPEEKQEYWDYISDCEDQGCEASSIPIEMLREATEDEVSEMLQQEREKRRKRNASGAAPV